MSDNVIRVLAWLGLAVHIGVAVLLILRRVPTVPIVPAINLVIALGILAYWVQRWYSYIFQGITWYGSDQLLPLAALAVAVMAVLALTGRVPAVVFQQIVLGIDTLVFLAAVLYMTFVKFDRLM